MAFNDSISVTLQDRQGNRCDSEVAAFRSAEYPRPIAATAERVVREGGGRCQDAGTYDVVVARKTAPDSTRERWDLELSVSSEPALKSPPATTGPGAWSSAAPRPPAGIPSERRGGTGFNDARSLRQGVWKDRIRPGQTLFYRVPLDWGQQLFTEAELGSSAGDAQRKGFVPSALNVTLYNPARTSVTSKDASYGGEPSVAALDSLPPVAYENRYLSRADEAGVRFMRLVLPEGLPHAGDEGDLREQGVRADASSDGPWGRGVRAHVCAGSGCVPGHGRGPGCR